MIYDNNYYNLSYSWTLYFRTLKLDDWDARAAADIAMGVPKQDRGNRFWQPARVEKT